MKLTKRKREVLRTKFGGCCAFCGSDLPARGWHVEDIGEVYVDDGIAPVCTECHSSRGNASPEAFRSMLAEQVERAERHSINFRTALRFGLVSPTLTPVKFWFERCIAERSESTSVSSLNISSAA
ncbi:HNH endonuclease [Rahnella sikkimica]|uniref:HNH endonuclease n=1 Tax=Rahnella sikkimica TaxID=1805933 RepID=A0A2L1UYZ9_9GAMM|nr:HNH endonuclease [Rahnella sikkimica]AVF38192.1 HNH endonuclease [Rahnella sikkimica]